MPKWLSVFLWLFDDISKFLSSLVFEEISKIVTTGILDIWHDVKILEIFDHNLKQISEETFPHNLVDNHC